MFYEILIRLCAEKGSSVTKYTTEVLGFSKGTATGWKNGKKPGAVALKRISDHFGVSIDFLLTGKVKHVPKILEQNNSREIARLESKIEEQKERIKFLEEQNRELIAKLAPTSAVVDNRQNKQ